MAAGARKRAEEFSLERRRSDLLSLLHLRINFRGKDFDQKPRAPASADSRVAR
jgi:hypothetical protein